MKQFFKKFLAKFRQNAFLAVAAILFVGSMVAGVQLHNRAGAEPTNASVEYFLKLDGIEGESNDKGHEGQIELSSFAWGGVQQLGSPTGGGGGTGKAQVRDINFTTQVNKSSPKLMEAAASNKHIKEAVLTARKAGQGQQDFLTIKISDVRISSYRTDGKDGKTPVDEVSLGFAKVEFSYAPQKADGSLDAPVIGSGDFLHE